MFSATDTTTPSRRRDRARYDRTTVYSILDEALTCHVSFVASGRPAVLPMMFVRIGDRLYLHGSSGSHPMLLAARESGLAVCVAATLLDGLVLARSAAHHSMAYRSVIAHGNAVLVTEPSEKEAALAAVVDRAAVGRSQDCRPPTARELAAAGVLRLDLSAVSAKVRNGDVNDEPEDLGLDHWAGFIPMTTVYGAPRPSPDLRPGIHPPLTADGHPRDEPGQGLARASCERALPPCGVG